MTPSVGDTLWLTCLSLEVGGWGTPRCPSVPQWSRHQGLLALWSSGLQEGHFQSWQQSESPEPWICWTPWVICLWSVLILGNSSYPLICWLWYTLFNFSPCVLEFTDTQLDVFFFVSFSQGGVLFVCLFCCCLKGCHCTRSYRNIKQVETNHWTCKSKSYLRSYRRILPKERIQGVLRRLQMLVWNNWESLSCSWPYFFLLFSTFTTDLVAGVSFAEQGLDMKLG